jgi:immunoglobulin-like protein involved in spore germination
MSKVSTWIIALLLIVIALLAWLAYGKTAIAPVVETQSTTTATQTKKTDQTPPIVNAPAPLHQKIVVTFPKANASVPKTFTVKGKAPGNWFSEAQAPVMVQASDGSKIAQAQARAQGDWQTTDLVDFTADVSIDPAYSGSATLVLLKDNPSGLPENDDSLEIPIVVQ